MTGHTPTIVEKLRRGVNKPDGAKRRPTPRELEAAALIKDMLEALREVTDDLEAEIGARRAGELPRRIDRDMEIVHRSRTIIAKATGAA
jgi:hypothetical protein